MTLGDFRFTLFNSITLFLMTLTAVTLAARWRGCRRTNWVLAYWAVILGYTFGFEGGLNRFWAGTGAAAALLIRFAPATRRYARWAEAVAFGYVLWRCTGLLLLW